MAYSGIQIKPSKVGSLHKLLGLPMGSNIPSGDLAAQPGDSPVMKKKKQFAANAKKFNHKGPSSLHKLMGG
jgi:hypothetical protein